MDGMRISFSLEDYALQEFPKSISASLGAKTREYVPKKTTRRTTHFEDGKVAGHTCDACGWKVHRHDSFCRRCGARFVD